MRHGVWAQTGVSEYFKTAIRINKLFGNHNLFNYLETSGIIASDDSLAFSKQVIIDAIQKVFMKTPPPASFNIYLSCTSINATYAYLNEVNFCTNPEGKEFISCPPEPDAQKPCTDGTMIILPLPKAQPPIPSPQPPPPPQKFEEEIYGTYLTFGRSWAKYIFNG